MKDMFRKMNIRTGILYFYIHFVTELICFFALYRYTENAPVTWLLFFAYDMLAFAPQSIIGYVSDKFPKLVFSIAGLLLMSLALIVQRYTELIFTSLVLLCIGNAFVHVNGAEVTLRSADGHLSPSAVFVSGGSFGVVSGRLLSSMDIPLWPLILLAASAIPFALLAQTYVDMPAGIDDRCKSFRYSSKKISRYMIIILAVLVVMIRGYMGYGIPTSWRKTTLQTILLFVFMGMGKALGGILSDIIGIRKVAFISVIIALPLLLFGDQNMYVSLIGVMMFSMTMSVTLAILVSVLPRTPGLAFGFTTIGLFLGTAPIFFFRMIDPRANAVMLTVLSLICLGCLLLSLEKEDDHGRTV